MVTQTSRPEIPFNSISGWLMLPLILVLGFAPPILLISLTQETGPRPLPVILTISACLLAIVLAFGFFIVSPNTARVLVLFGNYRGTERRDGLHWTNPFTMKPRVSLKAHNLNGQRIKVNDLLGNPIEIAAVVVWQVQDTGKAMFEVQNFEEYVSVQSEAALRQLASAHPYDDGQHADVKTTLRGSGTEVARELAIALEQRLERAGVEVLEARLSHLAYAPEIASAMLQRQQASAVIAARAMIVEGAVGMVEMALTELSKKALVVLDDERKAQLVGNLLVVLCAHENPQPVLNTGSLYT
ncbi:MAG TPA: SPFH domain-containing protein [Planctomycetota bacterium]|nr:SPFH domain-containing protein [Planctomycetota bacterium]